ncbi:MAG: DUF5723 family protein [Ignavibacteria bacterium]
MGSTSVSNSYEVDAFNQNPANIVFQKGGNNSKYYFNLLTTFQFLTNSNYLSLDFYNDYFGENSDGSSTTLTDSDKRNIINSASDQKSTLTSSGKLLSFLYNHGDIGTIGISLEDRVVSDFLLTKDFWELGLYGNEPDRLYNLENNSLNVYWTRQLNISFAKLLKINKNKLFESIAIGAAVKPQFGIYYFETTKNNLTIQTNSQNTIQSTGESEFLYSGLTDDVTIKFPSGNAGFGFGFDAGVNFVLKEFSDQGRLSVGLSITDIGYIKWNTNNATYYNNGNFIITDVTNQEQIDSLKDAVKSTKTPVSDFSISLPTTARLGATYKIYSKKNKEQTGLETGSISFDYIQGITSNLGGTTEPRFGLGAEYNVGDIFSPRAGLTFGGDENTLVSIGLGVEAGPVMIDMGTNNIMSIFTPSGTTNLSAGLNIKYRVN